MIANKKKFYIGLGMVGVFTLLLIVLFSPVIDGRNALQYSDELYNSISKDSAYYIPDSMAESEEFLGTNIDVNINMEDETQAQQTAILYETSGAMVTITGASLQISGDLGQVLVAALGDADKLYNDETLFLSDAYGYESQRVVYNWHTSLNKIDKALKDQDLFDESKIVAEAMEKGIEPSYNYAGIQPESMSSKVWVVIGSLLFYVFYTVWYGFGLMYILEGWGLKIGAH